jgi:uncharacterized surface protein with fasciclin (FAS1) repeats
MKRYKKLLLLPVISALLITWMNGCKKLEIVETTTSDLNIYGYLVKNPDRFSELVAIIDKIGYDGFMNAYGTYTFFAPTNDAVQKYLQENGKSSIDQFTDQDLKDIMNLHLINDTINTKSFKDGKLPQVTLYGQYLLTGVVYKEGSSYYTINRTALVTQSNISTGNGNIHVLDHVLKPAKLTLWETIKQNPEYSIFAQAVQETRFDKLLNTNQNPDTTLRWLTLIAESNKILRDSAKIFSYQQLKDKYCKTGDPANPSDSLYLYVAYHLLSSAKYLADIVTAPSHPTLAPLEVVTSKLEDQTVLLNDINFNGVHERGIQLERATSDIAATNGVLHNALNHFAIKVRKPVPVYWDVADFPEIRKLPAYFRKQTYVFQPGSIQDIKWEKFGITYIYNTAANFPIYYNDCLQIPLGTAAARNLWVELRTPLLVKGTYKMWICYRQQGQSPNSTNNPILVFFDGEVMPRTIDCSSPTNGTVPTGTEAEREALGWKLYTPATNNYMAGRLVGTVTVKTTDRHVVRMQGTTGGQNLNNFDMIHFIPIDAPSQTRPVFARDGSVIP